jgi:hypothetical protein
MADFRSERSPDEAKRNPGLGNQISQAGPDFAALHPGYLALPPACRSAYVSTSARIMRWYGTRRFLASRLKKSRLRRDSDSGTLTLSSRGARSTSAGRKSSITRTQPMSPAVYLILFR